MCFFSTFWESHLKCRGLLWKHWKYYQQKFMDFHIWKSINLYICWDFVISISEKFPMLKFSPSRLENCETIQKLHMLVCGSDCIKYVLKPGFWLIGVFTIQCNASKWPQMPQKWIRTIPFWSGHTWRKWFKISLSTVEYRYMFF